MPRWVRLVVLVLVVGVLAGAVAAAVGGGGGDDGDGVAADGSTEGGADAAPATPVVAAPPEETAVVAGDDPVTRAVAASAALYREAPVAVLAPAGAVDDQALAASAAVRLGAPLLLVPEEPAAAPTEPAPTDAPTDTPTEATAFDPAAVARPVAAHATEPPGAAPTDVATPAAPSPEAAVAAELDRLGVTAVVGVGDAATRWAEGRGLEVAPARDPSSLSRAVDGGLGDRRTVPAEELPWAVADLGRDATATLAVGTPEGDATPTPGTSPAPAGDAGATEPQRTEAGATGPADEDGDTLPATRPAGPLDDLLVLVGGEPADVAPAATARAAGARVLVVPGHDPRAHAEVIGALAEQEPGPVLAVGGGFGPPERLRQRLAVAATGVQLPGGGQVVYPGRRMVALYGHPGTPALGVLGEQDVDAAIARANEVAAPYGPLSDVPVVPAFEIITTIASSAAGEDGDYSDEATVEEIRPWVDAAREAGVYVVLDLQPGRTDFLTQAQRYEELLVEPHVGLALDPEWRLEPDQVHLRQIGSVDIEEVNQVITWLADLTRERQLPQKLLILHQFRLSMIEGRERVDTGRDELAVLVHADGNGTLGLKLETWGTLTQDAPEGLWWGWKNFYDEDSPTPTPEETMAVEPTPLFISYQ